MYPPSKYTMAFKLFPSKSEKTREAAGASEEELFLPQDARTEPLRPKKSLSPWVIVSGIQGFVIVLLFLHIVLQSRINNGSAFPTDFEDAKKAVEYEQRKYTGALVYDSDTKQAIRLHDAEMEYFGEPSQELDEAWYSLLKGASLNSG